MTEDALIFSCIGLGLVKLVVELVLGNTSYYALRKVGDRVQIIWDTINLFDHL